MLLDPGMDLTLRPMHSFYERYRDAIKNTRTVEEVDFSIDVNDLNRKMSESDRHLIHRLVASLPPAIDAKLGTQLVQALECS